MLPLCLLWHQLRSGGRMSARLAYAPSARVVLGAPAQIAWHTHAASSSRFSCARQKSSMSMHDATCRAGFDLFCKMQMQESPRLADAVGSTIQLAMTSSRTHTVHPRLYECTRGRTRTGSIDCGPTSRHCTQRPRHHHHPSHHLPYAAVVDVRTASASFFNPHGISFEHGSSIGTTAAPRRAGDSNRSGTCSHSQPPSR